MSVLAYTAYNLALGPVAAALAPLYLARFRSKRAGSLRARLGLDLPRLTPGGVWIHALSVGETASALPLLEEIRTRHPELRLWLTAGTRTGLVQGRRAMADGLVEAAFHLPLDFPPAINHALDALRPSGMIIVETDIWPNLLRACRLRRIPTALVNFRISASRHRSHRLARPFFRSVYSQLSGVTLPSKLDQKRFAALGLTGRMPAPVTGSLKYDRPAPPAEDRRALGLEPDRPVIIAGSTHAGEEEIVLEAWTRVRRNLPETALIIAPRDAHRFGTVADLARKAGHQPALLSRKETFGPGRPVLVADTIGRLAGLYGAADAAFVGGSLVNKGGHNPLEPASLAVPVLFGPCMADFLSEAGGLINGGGGLRVGDASHLARELERLLTRPDLAGAMGRAARNVFEANHGAAQRTADLVDRVMRW